MAALSVMPWSAFEALEFIDWFRAALAGWRFLFSSAYRGETRHRWSHESAFRVIWDISCGIAGIAFTLVLVWVLVALFAGWDWLTRAYGA